MAKIAGQRSKDAGQDADMQDNPAKSGTVSGTQTLPPYWRARAQKKRGSGE